MLIKITNICNEVGVGAFYHSEKYSPHSHVLPFEPYIGDFQLKLNESIYIKEDLYTKLEKTLIELKEARIIDFEAPKKDIKEVLEKVEQVVEKVEETVKEVIEKVAETKEEIKEILDKDLNKEIIPENPMDTLTDAVNLTDPEFSPFYVDTVYKEKITTQKKKKR